MLMVSHQESEVLAINALEVIKGASSPDRRRHDRGGRDVEVGLCGGLGVKLRKFDKGC